MFGRFRGSLPRRLNLYRSAATNERAGRNARSQRNSRTTTMTILSALIQTYMAWKRHRTTQQQPAEQ
jgi:hypothetical protein